MRGILRWILDLLAADEPEPARRVLHDFRMWEPMGTEPRDEGIHCGDQSSSEPGHGARHWVSTPPDAVPPDAGEVAGATMNTATIRRNGHAPSEATCRGVCKALLGSAIKGDADAAREIAAIPFQAWPDKTMREAARHIIELTADGAALELPILLHRLAVGGKVTPPATFRHSRRHHLSTIRRPLATSFAPTTESAKGGIWRTCGP